VGGLGSGNYWKSGKPVTVDYCALDIRRLSRDGLLRPGHSFDWNWLVNKAIVSSINIVNEENLLVLSYKSRRGESNWEKVETLVYLDYTECHLGGLRPWFICPARDCSRRVAILYAGSVFACRNCHRLAYQSQRETSVYRAMRRADSIREKLGWEPGIFNINGGKPKRMRWMTFERLQAKHDTYVDQSIRDAVRGLGLQLRNL